MKSFIKTLSFSMVLLACLAIAPSAQAQLHVDATGEVGIGTTSPSSKLQVNNSTVYRSMYLSNSYTGSTSKYGIYNYVNSSGTGSRYGLYNTIYSNASSAIHMGLRNNSYIYSTSSGFGQYNYTYCYAGNGPRYGIYNYLGCSSGCGTGAKYGLYSAVSSTCGGYAGYFSGDVYISGSLTQTSDATKKTNIQELNGALGVIGQLQPKTYDYINDENLALPREKQYGFMAQELEQVLPDLVKDVDVMTEPTDDEESLPETAGQIKTVNYTALIPILVQGMQEQQEIIKDQQKRIEELEAKIDR